MNIWIDLANSPQVLVFRPILAELERRGHRVLLTTRVYAQTVALADEYGLKHTVTGRHGGNAWSSMLGKTIQRVQALLHWARQQPRIDLAVSHASLGQVIAAARLRLPAVALMDYEFQPTSHVIFRLARRVIVPECFPEAQLKRFGAHAKAKKYAGIKEQIYLSNFVPRAQYLETLGIATTKPVIVMRPPAPWAAYHRHFRDTLFEDVLKDVAAQDVTVVFIPRVTAQADRPGELALDHVWVPPRVLDGPNLVYHADAVISGGGTMNREAGVLGTPAYTVFKGKSGAADEWLVARKRLTHITRPGELPNFAGHSKTRREILSGDALVDRVTHLILETVS